MLLALVCLWMSSGATLRHTDQLGEFRSYAVHQSQLSTRVLTAAADDCVAHEWMNAWQHCQPSTWRVVSMPLFEVVASLTKHTSPTVRFAVTALLRGPPALSISHT
jgi:hypothetical protein